MALDGIFLRHIKKEIETTAIGAKVDRIYQPNKDEILLFLRNKAGSFKLLLSSRANSPRIHFTSHKIENPKSPYMLCMLFRKRLTGAKLIAIRQPELERVLCLDFEATNELGDIVKLTLVAEIMGKYSNVILIDENEKVIDSLKRVSAEMSSKRIILPGIKYELPPAQNKLSILSTDINDIVSFLLENKKNTLIEKALLSSLQGVSPIVCREISYLCTNGQDMSLSQLDNNGMDKLKKVLLSLHETALNYIGNPYMLSDSNGKPIDFSFLDINQYEGLLNIKKYNTFSELLDNFYYERDSIDRMRAKSSDLIKNLSNILERLDKKIAIQKSELEQCVNRGKLKICADLINANLYRMKKGMNNVSLENFYDPEYKLLDIKLDPLLTPSQNAQKYYKEYRKSKTAETELNLQIEKAATERDYIETVLDSLSRATCEEELEEIKQELFNQNYLKSRNNKKTEKIISKPLEFKSTEGFKILVGKNNVQNDKLSMKRANKDDLWFHVKDIPGSHVVLFTEHKEPSFESITQAATIAAFFSKAKNSSQVPVDYTKVKYVSKPNGAKPGKVIYVNQNTIFVKPDSEYISKLKCRL